MARPKTIKVKSSLTPRFATKAPTLVLRDEQTLRLAPKKKAKKRARIPGVMSSRKSMTDTMSLAESIIDPFKGAVCVPDGFEGGCFSLQFQSTLLTDAQGYCAFALAGDPYNLLANIVGNGTTGWNIPGTSVWQSSTNVSSVASIYSKIRVISMGLKLVSTQSSQTDQGGIICAQIPGNYVLSTFNALGTGSFAAVEATSTDSTTGSFKDGCMITWRPESSINTFQYSSYNNSVGPYDTQPTVPGIPYLFLGVQGAAASTVVGRVECIVNFQGQYKNVTFLPGNALDIQSNAEPGWMEKVVNIIKKVPQFLPLIGDLASAVVPGGGLIGRLTRMALA
jgi:hypothetical protein